ncbi:MAG: ABC transporter substrate-binding protein [Gammaproteobacteria bacterium]|nr:ABC transporter substrate-binding protein [Gammaproteobacteria bacterium]
MLKRISMVLIMLLMMIASWPALAEPMRLPHEIITQAASSMAEQLKGRKDYLEANRKELYALIDEILVPYFDTRYAGRLVLGKHWKVVTKAQRDTFIDVFYEFLLQSYANGILKFDEDNITVYPADIEPGDKRVTVKTDMRMNDGVLIPVNYKMRKSTAGWRVYDVRFEGVSYIQNYRNQFNAEIGALGIEAVIERLQSETRKARLVNES